MGRPRAKPIYAILHADLLGCIGEDLVLDFESDPEKPFLDELQFWVADELLVALRRSFSVTFPRNPFVDGLSQTIMEIRRLGVAALTKIPDLLK